METAPEATDWKTAGPSPAIRLIAEFLEMPGLRLNPQQTARLIGVDVETASRLLASAAERGFLRVTANGYVRA
jgi:DNA-binding MarR family transcriptional regulator